MKGYVVECFWPGVSEDKLDSVVRRAAAVADELRLDGGKVEFRGTILMLGDETVFHLFEGVEADVRAVSERAGVRYERVLESVLIGEPRIAEGGSNAS